MSEEKRTYTSEAKIIKGRMSDLGISAETVAARLDVSGGMVSQWRRGYRPVAANHAVALAKLLQVDDPSDISPAWRDIYRDVVDFYGLARNRERIMKSSADELKELQRQIDELQLVLAANAVTMTEHRPAEARDFAALIRKRTTPQEARGGFVADLLDDLGAA